MLSIISVLVASQVALVLKNPSANAREIRDMGSVPGSGRSPGVGNGNPDQYSCLENPMDRGVCQATVCGVTKSLTQMKQLSMHQFSSVAQSCPTLCNPMNRSTPGLPVHHQLPEFTQTHAH